MPIGLADMSSHLCPIIRSDLLIVVLWIILWWVAFFCIVAGLCRVSILWIVTLRIQRLKTPLILIVPISRSIVHLWRIPLIQRLTGQRSHHRLLGPRVRIEWSLSMRNLIVLLLTCCSARSVHFLQLIMAVTTVLIWLFGVCLSRPLAGRLPRDAFGGGRSRYRVPTSLIAVTECGNGSHSTGSGVAPVLRP